MSSPTFTVILAFYTLFILGGIHYYEDKITRLNKELDILDSDYDRYSLDRDNSLLQAQIKDLKATVADYQRALNLSQNRAGSQGIQYESSVYKTSQWESTYSQDKIDFEQ